LYHSGALLDGQLFMYLASSDSIASRASMQILKKFRWGENSVGQLGTSDLVNRYVPVRVLLPDNSKVLQAACGPYHTVVR
jgi:alpha-tubulin suppressor-like RCC1 family protein